MKKLILSLALALTLVLYMSVPVLAATTADVTVTATPSYVAIADNATAYDFGIVSESTNYTIATNFVAITNSSSVQTDVTIAVTTADWASAGVAWTYSNTATAGTDIVGLVSNNATWGVGDVIVESSITGSPNFIYENLPSGVNFTYALKLVAPSAFTDGVQKSVTVRVTAVSG